MYVTVGVNMHLDGDGDGEIRVMETGDPFPSDGSKVAVGRI